MTATQVVLGTSDLWHRIAAFQDGYPHKYHAFNTFRFIAVDSSLVLPCSLTKHPLLDILKRLNEVLASWLTTYSSPCALHSLVQCFPGLLDPLLWLGAYFGDEWLLQHVISFRIDGRRPTPVWIPVNLAAQCGHLSILKLLYEHRQEGFTFTAVEAAAECGQLSCVEFLVNVCHFPCSSMALHHAAGGGHLEVVKYINSVSSGIQFSKYTMTLASSNGHLSTVLYLLACDAPSNRDAIDVACRNGHLNIVKALTDAGKSATKIAMDWAAENGHLEIVQYLHTFRREGCTRNALYEATRNGHTAVVNYLIANGLNDI